MAMPDPSTTPLAVWLHVAEIVLIAVLVPLMSTGFRVVMGLRDATRALVTAIETLNRSMQDHEDRLRYLERRSTPGAHTPERRTR